MNINQFNDKIAEMGKKIFGNRYSFSSSNIDSVMYSHCNETAVTYRATIFLDDAENVSFDSIDVDVLFDKMEFKYKELNAKQSDMELG